MSPNVTRIGIATATSASPAMSPDAAGTEYCSWLRGATRAQTWSSIAPAKIPATAPAMP